jgi:L-lactate dehydrogenase (cytochrome)
VLSNHGGRQLDFARSGIEVLAEVVTHLREKRGLEFPSDQFSLFVDGGVRRATDVLKAIALGATAGELVVVRHMGEKLIWVIGIAVGIGRPFLYALSSYGTDGVDRALQILRVCFKISLFWQFLINESGQDEIEMDLRLLGAPTIRDVVPSMVDASNIHSHVVSVPTDNLYDSNCGYHRFFLALIQ